MIDFIYNDFIGVIMNSRKKEYIAEVFLVGVAILINLVTLFIKYPNFYDYWFSSGSGNHFQWVGISVVIAALGVLLNAFWNRRTYKMNLISKNRIEWIETFRDLVSDYIVFSSNAFVAITNSIVARASGNYDHYLSAHSESVEANRNLETASTKLIMMFSNSDDMSKLIDVMTSYGDYFTELNTKLDGYSRLQPEELKKKFPTPNDFDIEHKKYEITLYKKKQEVLQATQMYLKHEWDKAKIGK